ncbi:hypothetical protein LTS18_001432, partial [Coniosporium uncinatum]
MFNTSEVTNEYNLLNDFLTNSLLDDNNLYSNDDIHGILSEPGLTSTMGTLSGSNALFGPSSSSSSNSNVAAANQMLPPSQTATGNAISRPASGFPLDKARREYYLTAADPAGNESPEERMNKVLKAKYDAGILKPFNYVKGYARLN